MRNNYVTSRAKLRKLAQHGNMSGEIEVLDGGSLHRLLEEGLVLEKYAGKQHTFSWKGAGVSQPPARNVKKLTLAQELYLTAKKAKR